MKPVIERTDDLETRTRRSLVDTRSEFSKLAITVDGGTVRLSGCLGSFYLRQLALASVRSIVGVTHVIDDMQVPVH